MQPLVDENGNPLPISVPEQPGAPPSLVRPDGTGDPSQQELDQAFPPGGYAVPPGQRQPLPPRQPDPRLPPPDPAEPRPNTP
jgi:penicillin-binding protein 1A